MARIASLSILNESEGKEMLAEAYGKVIDNIEKTTISSILKNVDLSGDPTTGTVEAKRFQNTESQNYGTARAAHKGTKIKADPVVIAINTDKELINEVEEKDVRLYGVSGLIERKSALDQRSMARELERAFFKKASDKATDAALAKTAINEKLEELIQKIETVKNDYVDGVPRDMISVICNTSVYGEMRDYLDTAPNANVDTYAGEFGGFHGVNVYSSVYLPSGIDMIAMVEGAVAQPVLTWLDDPGKIQLSNAWHFGMFYSYGTEAVMPDLIFKEATASSASQTATMSAKRTAKS